MAALQRYISRCGIEPLLLELIKLRVSQINGCAFCISVHVRDARVLGESEERMHLLDAWRDTSLYSARERAALAWAEAVALVAEGHVPDAVYETARREFTEKELVDLTYAVIAINGWNRLTIAFRRPPELARE